MFAGGKIPVQSAGIVNVSVAIGVVGSAVGSVGDADSLVVGAVVGSVAGAQPARVTATSAAGRKNRAAENNEDLYMILNLPAGMS
jgi:hypothetical protein